MQSEENIADELSEIEAGLRDNSTSREGYCQLYAAQQALAWVLNPAIAQSPFSVIISGLVQPLMDTPAD